MSQTRITINGKEADVLYNSEDFYNNRAINSNITDITAEVPTTGANLNEFFKKYRMPGQDEIAYKLNGRYYLAHLHLNNKLPEANEITSLQITNEMGAVQNAEALWVDDQDQKTKFSAELDVQFIYPTRTGVTQATDNEGKIRKYIAKKLHVKDGHITANNANDLNKIIQEFYNKVPAKTFGFNITLAGWDPATQKVSIKCEAIPPAKKIYVNINYSGQEISSLSEAQKRTMGLKMEEFFKTPCTQEDFFEGLQKLNKKFSNPDFVEKELGSELAGNSYFIRPRLISIQDYGFDSEDALLAALQNPSETSQEYRFAQAYVQDAQTIEQCWQTLETPNDPEAVAEAQALLASVLTMTADGSVMVNMDVQPAYKDIRLQVQTADINGNITNTEVVDPRNMGIDLPQGPVTEKNIQKITKAIHDYYSDKDQGYLVQPGDGSRFDHPASTLGLSIVLHPLPQDLMLNVSDGSHPTGGPMPSVDDVSHMFTDAKRTRQKGKPVISSISLERGTEELARWYEDKGYFLKPSDGHAAIETTLENGHLVIRCQPLRLDHVEIYSDDVETIQWLKEKDEKGVSNEEKIRRELRGKQHDYINSNEFMEDLALVSSELPLDIIGPHASVDPMGQIQTNAQGECVMNISVTLKGNYVSTPIGGTLDTAGGMLYSSHSFISDDGKVINGTASLNGLPSSPYLNAGINYTTPWINDKGDSRTLHAGLDWMNSKDYLSPGVGASWRHPLGNPRSHWSLLYGIDFQHIASNMADPAFWATPSGGIQYIKNGWVLTIKASRGQRLNDFDLLHGGYWEMSANVSKKTNLSRNRKLYLTTSAEVGVRVGANPHDLTSLSMFELGGGVAQVYAKAKVGVLYKLKPGSFGLGLFASTHDVFSQMPVIGGGFMFDVGDFHDWIIGAGVSTLGAQVLIGQ